MAQLIWSIYLGIGAILQFGWLILTLVLNESSDRKLGTKTDYVNGVADNIRGCDRKPRWVKALVLIGCVVANILVWPIWLILSYRIVKQKMEES